MRSATQGGYFEAWSLTAEERHFFEFIPHALCHFDFVHVVLRVLRFEALRVGVVDYLLAVVRVHRVQNVEEVSPVREFVLRESVWKEAHDLRVLSEAGEEVFE